MCAEGVGHGVGVGLGEFNLGEAGFGREVRDADDDGFDGEKQEFAVGGVDAFGLIGVRDRSEKEGNRGGERHISGFLKDGAAISRCSTACSLWWGLRSLEEGCGARNIRRRKNLIRVLIVLFVYDLTMAATERAKNTGKRVGEGALGLVDPHKLPLFACKHCIIGPSAVILLLRVGVLILLGFGNEAVVKILTAHSNAATAIWGALKR